MKLLLDTTVLIDVLRNRKGRRELLADMVRGGHTLCTSAMNAAEVYSGLRAGEEVRTEALLDGLEEFEISGRAARAAGKLKGTWSKKGRTVSLADAIVAAIELSSEAPVVRLDSVERQEGVDTLALHRSAAGAVRH